MPHRYLGDALQDFVTASMRARLTEGGQLGHTDGVALLELAETQRAAISGLRQNSDAYRSMMVSYSELAQEWLELVGILRLAGLDVGSEGGKWYFRIAGYERSGYPDVIAAYRAGLPALIIALLARGEIPELCPASLDRALGELSSLVSSAASDESAVGS